MIQNKKEEKSILIIGGGLIGLSLAYEFAKNNYSVEVLISHQTRCLHLIIDIISDGN